MKEKWQFLSEEEQALYSMLNDLEDEGDVVFPSDLVIDYLTELATLRAFVAEVQILAEEDDSDIKDPSSQTRH